jgi:hypothetical protein
LFSSANVCPDKDKQEINKNIYDKYLYLL